MAKYHYIQDPCDMERYLRFGNPWHCLILLDLQLRNGQLVTVPPILIRRLKSHFFALPCGVDIILGINGYIWVSKHIKEHEQVGEQAFDAEAVYSNKNDVCPAQY